MSKVVVGLSGGVDSSVAAYLLKKQGHEVIGVFMRNWHDETGLLEGNCPWEDDRNDAMDVAFRLGIPFHTVDLSEEYKANVVEYLFAEYEKGRTPNPDVLCNREIKFEQFVDVAQSLGAEYVATGHYCRKSEEIIKGKTYYQLKAGSDPSKDQSYFLCQLSQEQLKTALFPVGDLLKSEVRKIAEENDFITARKKDSQGICFIGEVDMMTFLSQQLKPQDGDIIEVPANSPLYNIERNDLNELSKSFDYQPDNGDRVGVHHGAHFFTIGQRKGINIGGKAEPLFVIHIDTKDNVLYVGQGKNHPGLYRPALKMMHEDIHWIRPDMMLSEGQELEVQCRIRYRQPLQKAKLINTEDALFIAFDQLQRGITPGQFAAWYIDDELVGSGVIFE